MRFGSAQGEYFRSEFVAPTVTHLSLSMPSMSVPVFTKNTDFRIPLKRVPNLVELSLDLGWGDEEKTADTPFRSLALLSTVLLSLASQSQDQECHVRAFHVKYLSASALPLSEDGFVPFPLMLPEPLEYVSWSIPSTETRKYYRVLRKSGTTDIIPRLQLLPPTFRPKVNRATGIWQHVEPHHEACMFDHLSDDGPVLKEW
ncbi:hypothetical protein V8E36_005994 [Tilletia maclaganii]